MNAHTHSLTMYTNSLLHLLTRARAQTHVFARAHTHTHTNTQLHVYTHALTHTHTHTLAHSQSVADEAGYVTALGVLLIGIGSTVMTVFLAIEPTLLRPGAAKVTKEDMVHGVVAMAASLVYFCAGVAMLTQTKRQFTGTSWSKDPVNANNQNYQCNHGTSAVFGPPIAAEDRDEVRIYVCRADSLLCCARLSSLKLLHMLIPPE